jgi:hypothetical protein
MTIWKPKIYFYKLTADNGGAPCVWNGLLSLAICKPMIRTKAKRDDLVFGFAANSLRHDNRLIYVARITGKVCNGDYYRQERFAKRGDRIYEWRRNSFTWRKGALHHGPKHLVHDLGRGPRYARATVLLSTDFRYFGGSGTSDYRVRFPLVREVVEELGRGHRVPHDERLRMALLDLKEWVWKNTPKRVAGKATDAPRAGVCHRSRSCEVVAKDNEMRDISRR